jgi:hypothetical protein
MPEHCPIYSQLKRLPDSRQHRKHFCSAHFYSGKKFVRKKLFLKSPFGLKRLLKLVIKFLLIVQIGKHSYDRELRRQRCKNLQRHK